jgi:hypothetical protein
VAMVFFLLMALGMRAAAEDTPIVSAVPAA